MPVPSRPFRHVLFALAQAVCLLLLLVPGRVDAQPTYLIDTGAGGTSSIGAISLFAAGSTSCQPQPGCASDFQFLAARITLPEAATITGFELWAARFSIGGSLAVKIREEVAGLPGVNAPPLFSANSIYAQTFTNLPTTFTAGWVSLTGYQAVLAAGTYWITLEPVAGSGLQYSLPGGAPDPLSKYAFYSFGNPGYVQLNQGLGLRVVGSRFDGAAFGTAARLTASGSFDTCCPGFDIDFITEGTRDFTRVGNAGPALTSAYIFQLGSAHVHGRGRLIQNGLSAGAYADTNSLSQGSGRGIAYRTFVNLGAQAQTIRVNAVLSGSIGLNGGVGRGGVYVFDTTAFTTTLNGRLPQTPGQALLSADDAGAIRSTFPNPSNISLARFFPSTALLASGLDVAQFTPGGGVQSVPLTTGLFTVEPNQAITVLFDVAVFAPFAGDANFGNTLLPAPIFISDSSGAPVSTIVAVGPAAATPPAPGAIALTPPSATTPVGSTHIVTARVTGASGAPVSDMPVLFQVTTGPNAGKFASVKTDANGDAAFAYGGTLLGTDTVSATVSPLAAVEASTTWVPGAVQRIALSPASASIAVGGSQAYAVAAFDAFDNSLGDVSAEATLQIAPDGSCAGSTCMGTVSGVQTVTATYAGKTAQATLTVEGVIAPIACDVDGNGSVNSTDLALLRTRNNQPATGPTDPYDPNRDGRVNVADVRFCQLRLTLR